MPLPYGLLKPSCLSQRHGLPLAVLSVMNILIGLADWTFLVLLVHKP